MSNSLFTNPITLDTVGATSAITYGLIITSIVWDSGSSGATGDLLLLNDSSGGNVIFQATLGSAIRTILWSPESPLAVSGLYLTTMTHGTLLVYLA